MDDQRQFSRIDIHCKTLILLDQMVFKADLVDLSLKGCLVSVPNGCPVSKGDLCIIEIVLQGESFPLRFNVKTVHSDIDSYGFKFIDMDVDTLTSLRRIVELNTGDADKVSNELRFLFE